MKRSRSIAFVLFVPLLAIAIAAGPAFPVGSIVGTIDGFGGPFTPVDVEIFFFDSVNAEVFADVVTSGSAGWSFDSGPLPPGNYKIRFWSGSGVGYDGASYMEFLGKETYEGSAEYEHLDVFDTARVVTVGDGEVVRVNTVLDNWRLYTYGCISTHLCGYVVDRITGSPLQGIAVEARNPISAWDMGRGAVTDLAGYFSEVSCSPFGGDVKVRFVDPTGYYSSEYYGAASDNFGLGSVVDISGEKLCNPLQQTLARQTPAQRVDDLIDDVQSMVPPGETASSLGQSLEQGKTLLEDENPNNDKGACGVLSAFKSKLNVLVAKGQLSQADADALAANADAIRLDLGCKN